MITETSISGLLATWNERSLDKSYSQEYRDALFDCIYELNQLLEKSFQEEYTQRELDDIEADLYFSSMEAFERHVA